MEFTEAFKQAGPCCFSPDSRFLAVAVDHRLFIRNVISLKVFLPGCQLCKVWGLIWKI